MRQNRKKILTSSVKTLYIITDNAKRYCEKSNGNTYLTILHGDERKETLKRYGEIWSKTTSNNSGGYDKKYLKIRFNSDDNLPLNKTLQFHNMIILFRSVFHQTCDIVVII